MTSGAAGEERLAGGPQAPSGARAEASEPGRSGHSRWIIVLVAIVSAVVAAPIGALAASQFKDVPDDNVHSDAIEWLVDAGVTRGCGDGTRYCPDDPVSRAQMATFFRRLAGHDPDVDAVVDAASVAGMNKAELIESIARASGSLEHTDDWIAGRAYDKGAVVQYRSEDQASPKLYEALVKRTDPDTSPAENSDEWGVVLDGGELEGPVHRSWTQVSGPFKFSARTTSSEHTASCPDGKVATGGGIDVSSPVLIRRSVPTEDGSGWTVAVERADESPDADIDVEVVVICVG